MALLLSRIVTDKSVYGDKPVGNGSADNPLRKTAEIPPETKGLVTLGPYETPWDNATRTALSKLNDNDMGILNRTRGIMILAGAL